jgi:hypothetical protein
LFEPSSRDLFPAFEQIPSIIPHGDGHFSTAKPFSPTDVVQRAIDSKGLKGVNVGTK